MPRQVQILISYELFDHANQDFQPVEQKSEHQKNNKKKNGSTTKKYVIDALASRIMSVLEVMRKPHCVMPFMLKGDDHIWIQFRSQQKHLGDTIHALQGMGIGILPGTRIDINELTTSIPAPEREKNKKKRYKWSDRMTTEEIFESIDSGSHLTFDYCAMTFVASLIAAVGLLTDSSVSVVASMLVSPLMGQILAVTWGITMGNRELICRGIRNEAIGVIICILVGFLVGAACGPFFGPANLTVEWATGNLTSFEISSRGSPWSLIGGGMVAIPSGIGVALALTGGGVNALVGVAISAALLPPIVNSGLCLSLAFWFNNADDHSADGYSQMGRAYYQYSLWSFMLFIVNFVLIILLALAVFKLKKLKPNSNTKAGWKKRMSTFGSSSAMSSFKNNRDISEEDTNELLSGDDQKELDVDQEHRISLNRNQSNRGHIEMNDAPSRVSVGGTHRVENPLGNN
jgi:uncharacterized hydrophobic protein (TIGR00271 family)